MVSLIFIGQYTNRSQDIDVVGKFDMTAFLVSFRVWFLFSMPIAGPPL